MPADIELSIVALNRTQYSEMPELYGMLLASIVRPVPPTVLSFETIVPVLQLRTTPESGIDANTLELIVSCARMVVGVITFSRKSIVVAILLSLRLTPG